LPQLSEIVLDLEYPKKMGMVRSTLIELIRAIDPLLARIPIRIQRIGKTSRAHAKAHATYRGEHEPDRRAQVHELLSLF
jgi:hypothetical protein